VYEFMHFGKDRLHRHVCCRSLRSQHTTNSRSVAPSIVTNRHAPVIKLFAGATEVDHLAWIPRVKKTANGITGLPACFSLYIAISSCAGLFQFTNILTSTPTELSCRAAYHLRVPIFPQFCLVRLTLTLFSQSDIWDMFTSEAKELTDLSCPFVEPTEQLPTVSTKRSAPTSLIVSQRRGARRFGYTPGSSEFSSTNSA